VIALAGVSRRSFYEQFASREACLAATCDSVVARSRKLAIDAWAVERGSANGLHAAFRAVLDDIAVAPKPARLVLVESLGSGPSIREGMELAGRGFAQMLAVVLGLAPRDAELRRLTSTALVAGVRHVILTRILEGREKQLHTLSDEVLDWCEAYRTPLAARVSLASAPRSTAPARQAPVAFRSLEEERARSFVSLILLTLDQGYASASDAQVAQFAGISTEAFHKRFTSKEQCFLALLEEIGADAMRCVEQAAGPVPWPDSVRVGMDAFLDYLCEHELLARLAFVEAFQLGPAAIARLTGPVAGLVGILTKAAPAPARGPLIAEQALTGALWGVVSSYPLRSRRSRLEWLLDQLTLLVLAPYVGPDAAVVVIESARRRASAA
jgi:AcrR family transcriptional regulator